MDGTWEREFSTLKKDARRFLQNTYGDIFDIGIFHKTPFLSGQDYSSKREVLEKQEKALNGCMDCALHLERKKLVFGSGSPLASLLLVGPVPTAKESEEGRSFLGEEEELLDKMLRAIGLRMDAVYITPIVKCPTKEKASSTLKDLRTCLVHLNKQISLLRPRVIFVMGEIAAQVMFNTEDGLANIRGVWQDYQGIPLIATWGTQDLIREPHKKKEAWKDLQAIHARLLEK